eukprot:2212308-Amphidinium_carterae.1
MSSASAAPAFHHKKDWAFTFKVNSYATVAESQSKRRNTSETQHVDVWVPPSILSVRGWMAHNPRDPSHK